jgi:type IV pilus assembly protein PilQ
MKRKWPWTGIVIGVSFVMLFVSVTGAAGAPSHSAKADTAAVMQTGTGYLENITFEKFKGKERVTLMLSRQSDAATEDQGGRLLLVRLENLFVPQELRRVQGEGVMDNMVRVVPAQRTVKDIPEAVVTLELNKMVPYSVRRDGHNILIDFNVAALPQKTAAAAAKPVTANASRIIKLANASPSGPVAKPATMPADRSGLISLTFQQEDIKSVLQRLAVFGGVKIISGDDVKGTVNLDLQNVTVDKALDAVLAKQCLDKTRIGDTITVYSLKKLIVDEGDMNILPQANRLISLDFQDAPIKSILQTLAEHGDVNIVSGDDVKSPPNVTVNLKKVPWKLAFDTVVRTNGLIAKLSCNNLIIVMTINKDRDEEKSLKATEKDKWDSDRARREEEQKRLEQEGKKKQISIEAKIIEATDDFFRGLGVQWGGATTTENFGAMIGTNPSGGVTSLPNGIGLTSEKLAVNFPMSVLAPSIGLVLGNANSVLSAQIQALETNSQGKVISSPKVTTMDGVKAIIKQGDEIPYVTKDAQGSPTVNWKEATLSLAVTPKITPDGKISMDVLAKNDTPLYERAAALQGNVPIRKSEVTSMVVVQDGETLVIGGILKTEESVGSSGVPCISKIPILGWLFKTENTTKSRRQVMVFITPTIVKTEPSPTTKSVIDSAGKQRGSWQP